MVNNKITNIIKVHGFETDFEGEIKPSSILGILQEIATEHAEEMGLGYADLIQSGYIWVLSKIFVSIETRPKILDTVEVSSWPHSPGKAVFDRSFLVKDTKGEICLRSYSRWCILKASNFRIMPTSQFPNRIGQFIETPSIEFNDWNIPSIKPEGSADYKIRIANSEYDRNCHVNNTKYADYIFNCFHIEELKKLQIKSFQFHYLKQSYEGEVLSFYRQKVEEDVYIVEGIRNDSEKVVSARICFQERA